MNNNINPMQFLQMIRGGANPEQLMISLLEQRMQGTPMGANLLNLAKANNGKGIEQIARNMCNQRGINYDQEFARFKQTLGI